MCKIKLSILLLISFFIFSCTNNQVNHSSHKYSVAYIGEGYDGLLLKNYLIGNLKNLNIYDQNSNFSIQAGVKHNQNLYITNIDNTSDREKINTELLINIINKKTNCIIYKDEIEVSQFYIYASSNKFLSNQAAAKKIKKDNTESAVMRFINQLKKIDGQCNE